MNPTNILLPSIAMALLTLGLLLYMGLRRVAAVKRGEVSVKFYRAYRDGEQPERLHVLGRHIQNHFEVPPLFHVVVLATYVTGLCLHSRLPEDGHACQNGNSDHFRCHHARKTPDVVRQIRRPAREGA
jgi:hypothetical protein